MTNSPMVPLAPTPAGRHPGMGGRHAPERGGRHRRNAHEREQPDHRATGMALIAGGEQCLEGAGVGLPREQMVTINEIEQRHGLSAQGMDHVSIVDDVAMLVGSLRRSTAPQREERGGAKIRPQLLPPCGVSCPRYGRESWI